VKHERKEVFGLQSNQMRRRKLKRKVQRRSKLRRRT
jgi:hypothetical protein